MSDITGIIATIPCPACKGTKKIEDKVFGDGLIPCFVCSRRGYETKQVTLEELRKALTEDAQKADKRDWDPFQ